MSSPEAKQEANRKFYLKNTAMMCERALKRIREHPVRSAFIAHRAHAKDRGIEFKFEFEAWVEWWGDDFELRGSKQPDELQMGRYGDEGAYEIGNVYKVSKSENSDRPRPYPHITF